MHKESFLVSSSSLNLDSESSRDLKIFHGEDSQLHLSKTVCFAFDGLVRSDHANIKNNKRLEISGQSVDRYPTQAIVLGLWLRYFRLHS